VTFRELLCNSGFRKRKQKSQEKGKTIGFFNETSIGTERQKEGRRTSLRQTHRARLREEEDVGGRNSYWWGRIWDQDYRPLTLVKGGNGKLSAQGASLPNPH